MSPRTRRTPAERAQETLDVAQRVVDRLSKRLEQLEEEAQQVARDLEHATKRRNHALNDPELPEQGDSYDEPNQTRDDDPMERNADAQQSGMPWEDHPDYSGPSDRDVPDPR